MLLRKIDVGGRFSRVFTHRKIRIRVFRFYTSLLLYVDVETDHTAITTVVPTAVKKTAGFWCRSKRTTSNWIPILYALY